MINVAGKDTNDGDMVLGKGDVEEIRDRNLQKVISTTNLVEDELDEILNAPVSLTE